MTMAHFRNIGSLLSGYSPHGNNQNNVPRNEDIVMMGYLAKRKNMKNRFYVLRRETSENLPARLECYDSERKFLDGCQPKKKYILKDCFNISQKTDKNNFVIALYINKDCIALVTKTEAELREWLAKLRQHKYSGAEYIEAPRREYEHVWPVEVFDRSLASIQNLTGKHFLCLTTRFLSLVRTDNPDNKKEFHLSTIKKCGFVAQFFYFELGRCSGIGCGEIYMQTEDSYIAQNINNSVDSAIRNLSLMSSTDSNIRRRTISDPQPEGCLSRWRDRSDSVPNNPRSHPVNVQQGLPGSRSPSRDVPDRNHQDYSSSAHLEDEMHTLDTELPELDEGSFEGLYGESSRDLSHSVSSSRATIKDLLGSDGDSAYMQMDSGGGERNPPNTLGISPRVIPCTGAISPMGGNSHGVTTPVSPSLGNMPSWSVGHLPSPQGLSGYHSRNPSLLDDEYVPMLSPGTQLPQGAADASSPYLDMGPGPSPHGVERRRTISTPTPIPISPSDEDSCYEMFGNSGSSSCTSGTPSDLRMHDIAGEERVSTPQMGGSLTPNYSGGEEPDSFGGPRPIRTNSVGSKPDQFKRKNRLDPSVPLGEPARVRAFSVGSRVSLKFGVGRHGASGAHHGTEHPSGGLGEMFPSIKECGRQAKSKSSSAPMLGGSPISHSWSGTPGSHFRGFLQSRNAPRETNLMELDFSKNKSCDVIPSEDKDKERRLSKERVWATLAGARHRSNSKSSGSSSSKLGGEIFGGKEKRMSEGDGTNPRGMEIPNIGDRSDYLQLDFTRSPRTSVSDPTRGYLPMHPPSFLSSSLTSRSGDIMTERRGPRTSSLNEPYLEMSSSLSSCASQDGYVDMTQGSNSGLALAASSSSSSNSLGGPAPTRTRRGPALTVPMIPSQELSSPLEDFDMDEEIEEPPAPEGKKKKKGSKRRSLRDGVRRKKSADCSGGVEAADTAPKTKASGPFATISNFITRKPAGSTSPNPKAPLSPKGSPLPPKGSSPFSSLKRTKSRDKEERETVSLAGDVYESTLAPPLSPQGSLKKKPPEVEPVSLKGEEKMLFGPQEACKLLRQVSTNSDTYKRSSSAFPDRPPEQPSNGGSVPCQDRLPPTISLLPSPENRNYVNMQPGTSSPQLSPSGGNSSSPKPIPKQPPAPSLTTPPEENYMMMGGGGVVSDPAKEPRAPSLPSEVTKRPEIPPTLRSGHCHPPPPSLGIEKLALKEEKSGSERSRSHSGPGAPGVLEEGAKGTKKAEDGRAASACSSPASYSPPTSPTLGSVSSMSSLSEGGLSSASSTCTVVNVGLKPHGGARIIPSPSPAEASTNAADAKEVPTANPPPPPAPASVSSSGKVAGEDELLNYVALDLGCSGNKSAKSASPRFPSKGSGEVAAAGGGESVPLSYVEIDFKRSEGLRNTSIARDSKRPH